MDNHIPHLSPKVDLNKFDGVDPLRWVTQMEHYFTLEGIIDDTIKVNVRILLLYLEKWDGGNDIKRKIQTTLFIINLINLSMLFFREKLSTWGGLPCYTKQD